MEDRVTFPGRSNEGISFLFATTSRPGLGPTQPPIQWVPETLSQGMKRSIVKVTTRL